MAALSPTVLDSSVRIEPSGIAKWVFMPTAANYKSPTVAEIEAGTDISGEAKEWDGWTVTGDTIDAEDVGTTFTSQVPGRTSSDTSSITCYADKTGQDIRALLPRGTEGYIIKADGGLDSGSVMDVFPVRVTSVGKVTEIGSVNVCTITFAITAEPAEDVTIPTATP